MIDNFADNRGLKVPDYTREQVSDFFQELYGYKPLFIDKSLPRDGSAYADNRILFYEAEIGDRVYVKNPSEYGKTIGHYCTYGETPCGSSHLHAVVVGQPILNELKNKLGRKLEIIPKTIVQMELVRIEPYSEQLEAIGILIMEGARGLNLSTIYLPLLEDKLQDNGNFLYEKDRIVAVNQVESSFYGNAPLSGYEFKPSELASTLGQLIAVNEFFFDTDLSERHIFYDNLKKEVVWIDQGKAFSNSFKTNNETLKAHAIQMGRWAHAEEETKEAITKSIDQTGKMMAEVLSEIEPEHAKHILSIPSYARRLSEKKPEYYEILKSRVG